MKGHKAAEKRLYFLSCVEMKSLLLDSDSNHFSVKYSKAAQWIYYLQMLAYFTVIIVVIYIVCVETDIKPGLKWGFGAVAAISFLFILYSKRRSLVHRSFYLSKSEQGITINNKITVKKIEEKHIRAKQFVSNATTAYYDISINISGKKFYVIFGADEKDKDLVCEKLFLFVSEPYRTNA
jgi:hypothetical protein